MCSLNTLYKAQKEAARGVAWKTSTQRYQINWLLNINRTANDLMAGREVCRGFHEFDICERGKVRHISSVHFSERVPQKALSQNILIPSLRPSLIDRNSANMKGKGVSYALAMLKRDLVRHYQKHGSEGYILLADYRDYFASIEHEAVNEMLRKYSRCISWRFKASADLALAASLTRLKLWPCLILLTISCAKCWRSKPTRATWTTATQSTWTRNTCAPAIT